MTDLVLKNEADVKEAYRKNAEQYREAVKAFREAMHEYEKQMRSISSDARIILYNAENLCNPRLVSDISAHNSKMTYQCYSAMNIIPHVLSGNF